MIRLAVLSNADRYLLVEHPKPKTYGDCQREGYTEGCPWVSCRYHLVSDYTEDWMDERPTCALVEAAKGEHTHQAVADKLGLAESAVRKIVDRALFKMRKGMS